VRDTRKKNNVLKSFGARIDFASTLTLCDSFEKNFVHPTETFSAHESGKERERERERDVDIKKISGHKVAIFIATIVNGWSDEKSEPREKAHIVGNACDGQMCGAIRRSIQLNVVAHVRFGPTHASNRPLLFFF
jgi:hypothetical protein